MALRKLIIDPTPKTPRVFWNPDSYTFMLEGRSIPEDAVGFYRKLNGWVNECGPELTGTVNFDFKLEYFNTSSSKCILDLFKLLQKAWEQNPKLNIRWYYSEDDQDMGETGRDYADMLDMPLELIEFSE
jgi:SiaC family regulatory phosphoprotein